MNTPSESFSEQQAPQTGDSLLHNVKTKAAGKMEAYEEKVRQSPEKAILIATAAGYCLHIVPLGSLIAAPVRVVAFLAKPALLALGVAKLCEIAQARARR